jgi:hypothetical protein
LSRFIPQDAAQIVIDQAVAVAGSEEGGLGLAAIFGVLVALYSASKGVSSLMEGLNVAFEVEEKRGIVSYYLTAFALTIGLIVGFLLIMAILAGLPALLAFLHLGSATEWLVSLARWPILLAILALGLAILYRYAPSRGPVPWHWITPGAGVACGLWLLGSILFAVYVSNFGSYNETFGALGGYRPSDLALASAYIVSWAPSSTRDRGRTRRRGRARAPSAPPRQVTPGSQPGESSSNKFPLGGCATFSHPLLLTGCPAGHNPRDGGGATRDGSS